MKITFSELKLDPVKKRQPKYRESIMQEIISDYQKICEEFKESLGGTLSWKWDDRFEAVLTEFGIDSVDKIRQILDKYLHYVWDRASIDKGGGGVQKISNMLGGVMSGQLLFTSDPDMENIIFCAWWPWGNGTTISIRLTLSSETLSEAEREEVIAKSREWIGL